MYNALLTALIVVAVIIILLVIMQPSKSNAASSLTGDSDSQQVKTKARGFEAFLIRVTTVFAVLFFVLAIALAMLSA